jgi:hypothetical protein
MNETWEQANQRYLIDALANVRLALQRHIARVQGIQTPDLFSERPSSGAMLAPPALETLCAAFRLSPFERDLLLLCAGMELDSGIAALCAEAQGDPQRAYPTFSLALAALSEAHWSAITPAAPLRRRRLIEPVTGGSLTHSPLRISERVLHYLAGVSYLDERLTALIRPVFANGAEDARSFGLPPSQQALAERIAAVWLQSHETGALPVAQLCGDETGAKRAIAATACAELGLALHSIDYRAIPQHPAELDALMRLWEREAALFGSALLLDCDDLAGGDPAQLNAVKQFIDDLSGALMISTHERRPTDRQAVFFEVHKPHAAEQRAAWMSALGSVGAQLNGQVDALVTQFDLSTHAIQSVGAQARWIHGVTSATDIGALLWDACRAQARPRLDDLAQRIETVASWDDLVVPEAQRRVLRRIVVHARRRAKVYQQWGFAGKGSRGLGIGALFAGASGVGKTMAAEALAHELRLDLYRVDLSAAVSKYIGETKKTCAGFLTRRKTAVRCCCSMRPMRCSANAPKSGKAMIALQTSRLVICCSAWRVIAAWRF